MGIALGAENACKSNALYGACHNDNQKEEGRVGCSSSQGGHIISCCLPRHWISFLERDCLIKVESRLQDTAVSFSKEIMTDDSAPNFICWEFSDHNFLRNVTLVAGIISCTRASLYIFQC